MHDTIQGRYLFDAQAWPRACATDSETHCTTVFTYLSISLDLYEAPNSHLL